MLALLQSPDVVSTIASNAGTGVMTIAIAIKALYDNRINAALQRDIQDLKAFIVGPDGKNGVRADVTEIKDRVIGLEQRERDRLEEAARQPRVTVAGVGSYQPPTHVGRTP